MPDTYVHSNYVAGTDAADDAPPGMVGEFKSATKAVASGVALTTDTTANVTTMVLTPGDWDVRAQVTFQPGATASITRMIAGVSATTAVTAGQAGSGAIGTDPTNQAYQPAEVPAGPMSLDVGPVRVNTAGSMTMYLVALGTFTASSLSAYGTISARRMR